MLKKAFDFFDKDGDGHISIDELKQIFQGESGDLTHMTSDDSFIQMIHDCDKDGDGKINLFEFARSLTLETMK